MKQKIVMSVQMNGDERISKLMKLASLPFFCLKSRVMDDKMNAHKGRTKALQIAAVANGVISVAIEGKEKDQLVVIGEEVDAVRLTTELREKVGYTSIVTVEEVKAKDEKKELTPIPLIHYPMYEPVVISNPNPTGCGIM